MANTMADFGTTINDTERVKATVTVTTSLGVDAPVTAMTLTQTGGDASFSNLAKDGTPLLVNEVALISGPSDGVSTFAVDIVTDAGNTSATITLTVVAGLLMVSIAFDTPEPK